MKDSNKPKGSSQCATCAICGSPLRLDCYIKISDDACACKSHFKPYLSDTSIESNLPKTVHHNGKLTIDIANVGLAYPITPATYASLYSFITIIIQHITQSFGNIDPALISNAITQGTITSYNRHAGLLTLNCPELKKLFGSQQSRQ